MRKINFIILSLINFSILAASQFETAEIIAPSKVRSGDIFPVIISIKNAGEDFDKTVLSEFPIFTDYDSILGNIKIYRGMGSAVFENTSQQDFKLYIHDSLYWKYIAVEKFMPIEEFSGNININQTWSEDKIYYITGDLIIEKGTIVVVEQGTRIYIAPGKNIISYGRIITQGNKNYPVLFAPMEKNIPWGGIELYGNSVFQYTIFFRSRRGY